METGENMVREAEMGEGGTEKQESEGGEAH